MIVTHIDGRSELLTDYKSLQRKRRVNGEYSLSFLLFKTERNEHSFPLTVEESLVEYDGQKYRIKKMTEKTIGNTPVKQIQADHEFFDLVDEYQYDTISGAKSLSVCLAHALAGTGYTFAVVDSFSSVTFEKYGNDNALSLIQIALNRFGAEIDINGKHLVFYREIGRDTDIQFRYKHNIKTIEKFVDSSNLSTCIKGFGKKNEDGSYLVTAEYESPLASYYGRRHAQPVYDERYITQVGLMDRLVSDLKDTPDVSVKLEAAELEKAGINTEQIELGDRIFTIYEPLNIDINARIVEMIEFPEEPTSNQFTIANFRNSFLDSVADFQRTKDRLDGIFEGKEKLPFNVLDDAVQRATLALQSAQTELEFENGIIARDPNDPSRLLMITSKGIGISTNGGVSFDEAITADGFNLSVGVIGQLDANNINVTELSAITSFLGEVYSGYIEGSTFRTSQTAPYALIKNDGALVLASADGISGDAGIKIDPSSFLNEPKISFHSSYYHATGGELDSGSQAEIYLIGDLTNPNYIPMFGMNSMGSINIDAIGGDVIIRTSDAVRIGGDFSVSGAKNASVPTTLGMVNVSAYETAEYYFGDIGRGEVVNGECTIEIDPLFAETVNTDIDYEVFLTPYGKGLIYVDPGLKMADSFVVKGDDIPFAYEIKAKRKGYEDVRLEATHESEVEDVAY